MSEFRRARVYAVVVGGLWLALASMPELAPASNDAAPAHPDKDGYVIEIQNLHFQPDTLKVPAGRKIKLEIRNLDRTPEEFESYDLNREKVVTGKGTIRVFIGPLKAGTYRFFGDFHQDTAQGVVVAE
jgi:plastocyanin